MSARIDIVYERGGSIRRALRTISKKIVGANQAIFLGQIALLDLLQISSLDCLTPNPAQEKEFYFSNLPFK